MNSSRIKSAGVLFVALGSLHAACSNRVEEDCAFTFRCEPTGGVGGNGDGTSGDGGAGDGGHGGSSGGTGGTMSGTSGTAGASASGGGSGTSGTPEGGGGGLAGQGGTGGTGGTDAGCDLTKSPRQEQCIVEEGEAIFVSPDGNNQGTGTKEAPVKTLARALTLARTSGKPIIACAGTYAETLTVSGKTSVSVYGGFDCEGDWVLGTAPTRIAPEKGVPLTITASEGDIVLEGLEFEAPSATVAGGSSIAAIVSDSPNVTFRATRLIAGDGKDGASAPTLEPYAARAMNGNAATGTSGGAEQVCTCPGDETTTGGKGGDADPDGSKGAGLPGGGEKGLPYLGVMGGEGGLVGQGCGASGAGQDGANRASVAVIGEGASTFGTWSGGTFVPASGAPGASGSVGQGGGGGRGSETAGGGGGGCGGCGGKGGGAGEGGGASIALISINSGVVIEDSKFVLGQGGKGGAGAPGQEGQGGGSGGTQGEFACAGGIGGTGSPGAAGGGGAGGISVGIVYRGAEPIDQDLEVMDGKAGSGGPGGDDLSSADDGRNGEAQRLLKL